MSSLTEMNAFEEKINITLLNDIIAFVAETAEATYAQKNELSQRCIFLTYEASSRTIQEKYGFLYLGELLERYEERFGMSDPDRRAIALALGYTRDLATDAMFIGNQRVNFLQEVRRHEENDIYLTGALYLINEGQSGSQTLMDKLNETQYEKTEELTFVMSLLPDFEQAFLRFKPQLLCLLGNKRSMPILGNTQILDWMITQLKPLTKTIRSKDMALFRALCALPSSHFKVGSKYRDVLLAHGYTTMEIAYANALTIQYHTGPDALARDSVVTQKVVVDLFTMALNSEDALVPDAYAQLSKLFIQYEEFKIKCYGCHKLLEALKSGQRIRNAETFIWFTSHAPYDHPAFDGFDIMDSTWDALAKGLKPERYRGLFERCLDNKLTAEDIQLRIGRYDALTETNYLGSYYEKRWYGNRFSLLIETGIVDLWQAFRSSLGPDGEIIETTMLGYIRSYVHKIKTEQAFHFCAQFLPQYGFEGYKKYFCEYAYNEFIDGLAKESTSSNCTTVPLTLQRDYLKDDEDKRRLLLQWVEEYYFQYKPEQYLPFIYAVLQDESTASLLPWENQRALFDLVIGAQESRYSAVAHLKQRYMTAAELKAEQDAIETARLEAAHKSELEQEESIRKDYAEKVDGSFGTILKYLNRYQYHDSQERVAGRIVNENLPMLLKEKNYALDSREAVQFLHICYKIVSLSVISFFDVQTYISQIKEAIT